MNSPTRPCQTPEQRIQCVYTIAARIFALGLSIAAPAMLLTAKAKTENRPNILFTAIDDLRPEFGAYGADHIKSPNLDRLAKESLLFKRAYCMVATCGASRSSMLTGVRPTKDRFITAHTLADENAPWATPWNTHFKNNGYQTQSLGKVYHTPADNAEGWSKKPYDDDRPKFHDPTKMTNIRGDSIRTDQYRYSEYHKDGKYQARMLYDQNADPLENVNISEWPELQETVSKLSEKLKQASGATQPD